MPDVNSAEEWFGAWNPDALVYHARSQDDRKRRLFGAACVRRAMANSRDELLLTAVSFAEFPGS